MIDIRNMKNCCIINSCNIIASFNYENEIKALYCFKHKKDNMINVKNKTCKEQNCKISPLYNYTNESSGMYCFNHKKEGMINVISNKCKEIGCNTQPMYNYINEKNGLYCRHHKKENMIDVKNKKCLEEKCYIHPSFGIKNEGIAQYCVKHKKEGMVDIISKKCIEINCTSHASYSDNNDKIAQYCARHKKENMIDIRHNTCKTDMCNTIISNQKYDGYCLRCFIYLFPDKPNSRNYKRKENSVAEFIQDNFKDNTIVSDKKIKDGCSKRRPDILIDLGFQVIIIEIDENQHIDYDCSCENKRMMELSQDIGHRPIIFIRFNPDEYLDNDNNNITSCWSLNSKGINIVKKNKVKEWNDRLNILKDNVQYWIDNNTDKTIEIVQLFYNQNNK